MVIPGALIQPLGPTITAPSVPIFKKSGCMVFLRFLRDLWKNTLVFRLICASLLIRIDLPSNLFECSPGDRRKGLLFRNEKPPKDLKHTSWWRTVSITCMQDGVFLLSSFLVRLVRLTCDFPTRRSPPLLLHHSSVRSIEVYACMLIVSIIN